MKKIVIIGPESTGKSTLCQQLAERYETAWCPEFAREYLSANGMDYSFEDLLNIARGQMTLEKNMLQHSKNGVYFIDTDMYVMKVWCEVAFNNCHSWILKQIAIQQYDLYLLCDIDLPWVKDDLREYPDVEFRRKLFLMYKDIVINSKTKWAIISGSFEQRFQTATALVDLLLNKKSSSHS
ncbi:MAG TPA: ATP-binding protein [Chitinophagaceae bacterium]|nr:ATP-binding protein [Chitinophagaceae bacterium]